MTLQLIEGIDHISSQSLATEKGWTVVTNSGIGVGGDSILYTMQAGRVAGQCFQITSDNVAPTNPTGDNYWIKSMASTFDHFVIGFAFNESQLPAPGHQTEFCFLLTAGAVKAVRFFLNSNGTISVLNSSGTTVATGTAMLTVSAFYFLEFKIVINGASGSVVSQVSGVQDIALTTGNFGSTAIRDVCLNFVPDNGQPIGGGVGGGVRTQQWDDLYILNTQASPNNDFLGDVHVYTLYANGAGTTTQWTPNTGSNFNTVNEHTVAPYPDGDTTYVASSTVNQLDTYAFDDLPVTTGVVYGLQTNLVSRKTDAVLREIAPVIRRTGTNYVGNNVALATSYVDWLQIYEVDPSTSAQWTVAGVNAAEFGEKLTV